MIKTQDLTTSLNLNKLAMAGGRCGETTEQKERRPQRMWKYHRQRERDKNILAADNLKRWGVVSLDTGYQGGNMSLLCLFQKVIPN